MELVAISTTTRLGSKTKAERYAALVATRKQCRKCHDTVNPSSCVNGRFDTTEQLGPWSDWQGNLDAEIMVVGQEWGGTNNYIGQSGKDSDGDPTNYNLLTLMKNIGREVPPPSDLQGSPKQGQFFFTNGVLCLRNGAATSSGQKNDISAGSFVQCGLSFLRPQIELIKPRAVLVLGRLPWVGLMKSFGLTTGSRHGETVDSGSVSLNEHTIAIPLFHCGARSTNMNRPLPTQILDWGRGIKALDFVQKPTA